MNALAAAEPQVVHALPGRIRVRLPDGLIPPRQAERKLRSAAGVSRVQANEWTGNVLILFDSRATSPDRLLALLRGGAESTAPLPEDQPLPPVVEEPCEGSLRRARIAVRGLDRDPHMARRVVERLRTLFGVRAHSSQITGRVLVDYDESRVEIGEILAQVARMEMPDLPGEDRPEHPLDRAPLYQAATRVIGATLGLTVMLLRRLTGRVFGAREGEEASATAGVISLLRSFPPVRIGLRRLLGRDATDLAFGAAAIATMTVAGHPLGVTLVGVEGFLLLREVLRRRAAWRRYEAGLCGSANAEPGAVVRLNAGERPPWDGEVVEGVGTTLGHDGLPLPLSPGARVPAGAPLFGGPFVLQLHGGQPFEPQPRPAPLAPSLYTRYHRAVLPASLAYAALTALLTRSPARVFQALLLVNPRPAIIGMEAANLNAASRCLRSGMTVVGTRPDRAIRRPDVLLLDGPRLLSDGFEIAGVVPLHGIASADELLSVAGGVAIAAGSPWGDVFRHSEPASDGSFNGLWAAATVRGVRFMLGSCEDVPESPVALSLLHHGAYLLALGREDDGSTLGYVALRPRLQRGVDVLVSTCRRRGTRVEMLVCGAGFATIAVAKRAGVKRAVTSDVPALIRERQRTGALVAFVSDSARAAPAFAACDLGIGLHSSGGRFPARADILAPDLAAIAEVVEAGARRDLATRDGVFCSLGANVFGAAWGLLGEPGLHRASSAVFVSALAALALGTARLEGKSLASRWP